MNVINNPSYVNNYTSNSSSSTLEKIASGLAINKASDDASGLAIADQLKVQKDSMAQSIENVSSGIAMSNIAQDGISSQKDLLENIKTETLKASTSTTSEEGRQAIADQINKYIDQFENIANSTTYNGQSLLTTAGDSTDDLTIVGEDASVEMEKADTTSVSDQLRSLMSDFVSNPDSRDAMLSLVDDSMTTLSGYESDFGSAANSLESMAENYMTSRTNIANAESQIRDADFEEMYSRFKKEDLQAQIGSFVQSQMNAVQSRVVPLIS